jgi:hypothetical protein
MKGPLRERRERTDRLDLVPEELDPERLPSSRRKDVDDAAADGELPSFVGSLDSFVAGEGEVLDERVDARLVSDRDLEARRTDGRRRHALGDSDCRDADEPARAEYVERPGSLADEVGRRLETGVPPNAAARKEGDALIAEKRGCCLRGISRVGVFGQQAGESAPETKVESGEQDGQRGLGNARTRLRERLGERNEPFVRGELSGEWEERGTVHNERRNRRVPLLQVYAAAGA